MATPTVRETILLFRKANAADGPATAGAAGAGR